MIPSLEVTTYLSKGLLTILRRLQRIANCLWHICSFVDRNTMKSILKETKHGWLCNLSCLSKKYKWIQYIKRIKEWQYNSRLTFHWPVVQHISLSFIACQTGWSNTYYFNGTSQNGFIHSNTATHYTFCFHFRMWPISISDVSCWYLVPKHVLLAIDAASEGITDSHVMDMSLCSCKKT